MDRYWQIAGDRVLLYLRCLNFPETQALDLALRALKEAEHNIIQGSGNSPVAEAMQTLRRLLNGQITGVAGRDHFLDVRGEPPMPSMPPIHRLHMIPEKM